MAKIPFTKISETDYEHPEVKALVRALIPQLTAIANSYSNGISEENMVSLEYTITISLAAAEDDYSPYPVSFTWNYNTPPKEVRIRRIKATDGSRAVKSGIDVDWTFDRNRITIHGLAGNLDAGKKYKVTLIAEG